MNPETAAAPPMPADELPRPGDVGSTRALTLRRAALAAFVVLLAVLPLSPVPEFWITQANYIGLYTLVVIGLVLTVSPVVYQTVEKIHRDTERDRYLSATEAKEYGLIDDVVFPHLTLVKPA